MGSKRPFDGEDFIRLPFKHARPVDSDEKLISFTSVASFADARQKDDVLGCYYGSLCTPQRVEEHTVDSVDNHCFPFEKDIESSGILSSVTENLCEDYASQGSDVTTLLSLSDHYPRKLVPIGREYQADIPKWDPHVLAESNLSHESTSTACPDCDSDDIGKFMGTCVVPMPDSTLIVHDSVERGYGRCSCRDSSSVRCVRQHVEEARASLLKLVGRDKFVGLGFLEMGEEVANGWSVEEQRVFHEVVYKNPVSLGTNFWLCLRMKLSSRTQRELVSYYYNVFMLRIRAIQNRSNELEIDSDDDEWHGESSYSFLGQCEDGEDSQLESSALDQDDERDLDHGNDFVKNVVERVEDSRFSGVGLQFKDVDFTHGYHCGNRGLGGSGAVFDALGNNYESYTTRPYYPSDSVSGSRHSDMTTASCFHTESSGSGLGLGPGLLYDSHESLMWGGNTFTSGLDLLPTSNMIEAIFGPGSWDKKSTDDENVS
uniref:Uncharacterized protein n=1 Tax=Kalanchoe fedtschenkoi TaxID=63787 RepID=A0A7N0TRZ0_KALFE